GGAVFRRAAPASGFDVSANVTDQAIRVALRPAPARGAAGALVRRRDLEVAGKKMTAGLARPIDKRLGQERGGDLSFQKRAAAAFPTADFAQTAAVLGNAPLAKKALQGQNETAVSGIDADRLAEQRLDGVKLRRGDQTEKAAVQSHENKQVGARIALHSRHHVVGAGVADIAAAVLQRLAQKQRAGRVGDFEPEAVARKNSRRHA